MKAVGANNRTQTGASNGNWYAAILRDEPIILSQIEIKYPIIFAERERLRNVWKKTANPIWAKDHPKSVKNISKGSVYVKNLISVKKYPKR